jgi:hypothetical protein
MDNGHRVRTAQILGFGRTSLYRYLNRDSSETPPIQSSGAAARRWNGLQTSVTE